MARKTAKKKTDPNAMWGGRYSLGPAEIVQMAALLPQAQGIPHDLAGGGILSFRYGLADRVGHGGRQGDA